MKTNPNNKKDENRVFDFSQIDKEIDKALEKTKQVEDRVRIAHEIKENPPKPGFMKTDVKPGIYSIDLNTDANWWFNHVCTVFPFLLDQGIRTHVDIKDSWKPEKRFMDFNYMFLVIAVIGFIGVIVMTKVFGWW